ncbi:MAG TPA: isochorismatase [Verrucomicrobiae bacterium]|nr:isochorismatase [Verrucomicrobiae bacterium]
MSTIELPLPGFYDPANVVDDSRWIKFSKLLQAATEWRIAHQLKAAVGDRTKIGLLLIDNQNTFCHPNGELFVAGADEDSRRVVEFVYRYLGIITDIHCTLDTHRAFAVFHPTFLVNEAGNGHPDPFTAVSLQDIKDGVWRASPFMASALKSNLVSAQAQLEHYTAELEKAGRYQLMIWPFHGMLGDKGHNLVSGLFEACTFHAMARGAQTGIQIKGLNPWVEEYSILGPEVTKLADGTGVPRRTEFLQQLLDYDVLIIGGQAKSHCVAWTIDDLLRDILARDPQLAKKVYILEDCTSPVTGFEAQGEDAFERFRKAGMHLVKSTDPINTWPDFPVL